MKKALVFMQEELAGTLTEVSPGTAYRFEYRAGYEGLPISLTMPVSVRTWHFDRFPAFFEGVLPEGPMLEGLLRGQKIERSDLFGQLTATGGDLVGAVTVKPMSEDE